MEAIIRCQERTTQVALTIQIRLTLTAETRLFVILAELPSQTQTQTVEAPLETMEIQFSMFQY